MAPVPRPPGLSAAELYETGHGEDGPARRKAFQAAFKTAVGPWLKQEGFVLNGATARRFVGDAVHLINLQRWKHGGGVAVNLGIHFRFLPLLFNPPPWESLEEHWCALRWRLTPDGGDFWWRDGIDAGETASSVDHLKATLLEHGAPWFDAFGEWPGAYPDVTVAALPSLAARFLGGVPVLAMARVLAQAQRCAQARSLVQHQQAQLAAQARPNPALAAAVADTAMFIQDVCRSVDGV
jgi:hypothetical protein